MTHHHHSYFIYLSQKSSGVLMGLVMFLYLLPIPSYVLADSRIAKLILTQQMMAQARHLYGMRCARCHGERGDGNGPIADLLDPRPRDFTSGMFKFRTTATGELPTDEDLFRVISRGIPGTSMPRWENALPEEARWLLVAYIKTFAEEFSDPEYDPYQTVVKIPPKIPVSPGSIAKGKRIFEKNKCWECHGEQARGNGKMDLEDGWGFPIRVPNLTREWNLKGGSDPQDIVYRFTTGLNGTPMPSFAKNIHGENRWHLANYIASIAHNDFQEEMILKVEQTKKAVPLDANAEMWRSLAPTTIFLDGQAITEPFWINNAVDMLNVRAMYNQKEIGFLIEWDDPFPDKSHNQNQEVKTFSDRYVKAVGEIPRKPGIFRDSIALQFPVHPRLENPPYFFRGDRRHPVNLWIWKSELEGMGKNTVEDSNAWGFKMPIQLQTKKAQQVRGKGIWKNGRWHVVFIRSLQTKDPNDIQFEKDRIIPIAFNVWDGSNGEHGMIMGLSSWRLIYLEVPPAKYFHRIKNILSFFGLSRKFNAQ